MNAIKNTIVSVTLLVVAFGAYTVLQDPPQHSLEESELTWDATSDLVDPDVPESSLPSAETLATTTDSHQDFMNSIGAPRTEPVDSTTLAPNTLVHQPADDIPSAEQYDTGADQHYAEQNSDGQNYTDPGYANQTLEDDQYAAPDANVASIEATTDTSLTSVERSAAPARDSNSNGSYYDAVSGEGETSPSNASVDLAPPGDVSPPTSATPSAEEFENVMNYVQVQLQQDQLGEALLTLSESYQSGMQPEQFQRVAQLMDQLAGTVIYSSKSYIQPVHQVQADETLESIAARYQLPPEFLARVNGLELHYQPVVGESLKVLQGPFRASINGESGDMTVYLGDYYAGRFHVQLGLDAPRHNGEFEVIEKSDGREFFDRSTGYRVAKDDPSNPYGHRWIGLRGSQVTAGHNVGIHVANENNPDAGCFRVSPVDADDLSAILSIGSRVTLVR